MRSDPVEVREDIGIHALRDDPLEPVGRHPGLDGGAADVPGQVAGEVRVVAGKTVVRQFVEQRPRQLLGELLVRERGLYHVRRHGVPHLRRRHVRIHEDHAATRVHADPLSRDVDADVVAAEADSGVLPALVDFAPRPERGLNLAGRGPQGPRQGPQVRAGGDCLDEFRRNPPRRVDDPVLRAPHERRRLPHLQVRLALPGDAGLEEVLANPFVEVRPGLIAESLTIGTERVVPLLGRARGRHVGDDLPRDLRFARQVDGRHELREAAVEDLHPNEGSEARGPGLVDIHRAAGELDRPEPRSVRRQKARSRDDRIAVVPELEVLPRQAAQGQEVLEPAESPV